MPKLHVIDGTPAPRKSKAAAKPADMVQCPRCDGREVLETRIGVMIRPGGKPFGGTKSLICANCQRNGERVVVA